MRSGLPAQAAQRRTIGSVMRADAHNRLQKGADFHKLRNLLFHLLQLRRHQRIGAVVFRRVTFQPLQQADVVQRESQRTSVFDERQRV